MTLHEEIRRGHEAERLMADPLLSEAFGALDEHILTAMKQCAVADVTTQHELVLTLQLMEKLKRHIKTHIQTGELAKEQKRKASLSERVKGAIQRVM